jgi:hypothetical protein
MSVSVRARGLVWAVVACPMFGWVAAWYDNVMTHGRLGTLGGILLLGILPTALAGSGNAMLRRGRGAVTRASVAAAFICFLGLCVYVLVFFLTVPPEFFQ